MISKLRDPLSGLTHFIGILLSIVGLVILLSNRASTSPTHLFAFLIYSICMILLYTVSTLYHWLPLEGNKLKVLRKIDHIMIFVFIAASYTPVCLITLDKIWGTVIFISIWVIALAGLFMKIFWLNAPRLLYTAVYLFMGFFIIIAIYPLSDAMVSGGLIWLGIGGLFYTTGAIIYAIKKPDFYPNFFGFHEVFHLFVMAGSLSHWIMMYYYV